MVAVELGILALVLAGPGPLWVERWHFLHLVPRAAVLLWQAGAVSALIAVIGAGVAVVRPVLVDDSLLADLAGWELALYAVIVVFTLVVVLRLAWALVAVARSTSTRRSRHLAAVDLVSQVQDSLSLPGLRVIAERLPVAYCLPSLRQSRVVLSSGTLATLDVDEVRAVVEHESAHIRARHDLVLDTFTALHRAFPIAVRSEIPAEQCRLLVEMLADDSARRLTGPLPLARAMVALAGAPKPTWALGAVGLGAVERMARLAAEPRRYRALSGAICALASGLVTLPLLIMVAPSVAG